MFTVSKKRSVKRKKVTAPLSRDMEYQKMAVVRTQENDAVVRFYAMLNIMVTFKGRPTYDIDSSIMEIKIKQPLQVAFYKVFQAMLNFPSNMSLTELVHYTCHEVLFGEIEQLHETLGLKKHQLPGSRLNKDGKSEKLTVYQRKARESRMRIFEDTITRFFAMLEIYTPYKMRPRLWDEQIIPASYMNEKIKLPICEAFKTFIAVMRQYPTKISKQQDLVTYTLETILPNCETGMAERGIRYQLTYHKDRDKNQQSPGKDSQASARSIWEPEDDDMKIALGYQKRALSLPSHSPESKLAARKYSDIVSRASLSIPSKPASAGPQKDNRSAKKSQLQNLAAANTAKPEAEDYSWIQPIGARVRRLPSPAYGRHHKRGIKANNEIILKKSTTPQYMPTSSSDIFILPPEEERAHTEAISYRRVLSPKQREVLKIKTHLVGAEEAEVDSDFVHRQTLGYPTVHSRRKREVKSAPVYVRRLHRHLVDCETEMGRSKYGRIYKQGSTISSQHMIDVDETDY